ncbi:MAG TPA: PorP/SprF family type IX secretion system membrane protein [Tenuifilaceae bacterium]|nr:PorP/SprF family type IX secretion system membrane protein [Tenuifilaceae bacterium]HPE17333.1 PorP/SprF family type IX secretion system membrane protein [Tenuifilaceae bacterium]HPJ44559.1 PorP/SprF family type IX secretion system membrane protein [Tenuifilaceae bacterium]HPQ34866.1 PorP/SprF family type IX secretion system membrane protein [Tenuifilaceae bacterium]HRX67641.1 PorP/SprF family type IX secretion system membrane protein [Tenuifilaceae bacterium]
MHRYCHFFLLLTLIFILAQGKTFSQDPGFSQFFSNQLYLNPAYAGNPKYQRIRLVYRNQWLTTQSPFVTYGVSYDRFFIEKQSGLGVNIINDVQGQGALNRLSADVIYSYSTQVAYNAQIRGGIQVGGILKSQNTSNLVFPDMIDPSGEIVGTPGFPGQTKAFYDFAAGVAGEWDIFYGGIAVHHIAQPIEAKFGGEKAKLPRKYTVHLGCELNLYKNYLFRNVLLFSPNIMYQQQQDFKQINIGFYLTRQHVSAGIWIKENLTLASHTFVIMAGYSDDKYSFAYSYDFSIIKGGFRGINTSTHEVTFGTKFKYKTRTRKKFRYIKCPKF